LSPWHFKPFFGRGGSNKIKDMIMNEYDSGEVDEEIVGLLRNKLRYLPPLMWISMASDFGYPVEKIISQGDLRQPIHSNLHYESISESEDWQAEDEKTYKWLISKLPIKLKVVRCIHNNKHIAWPMCVFDIKEVKDEVENLVNKPFLTMDNEYDKQIEKKLGHLFSVVVPKENEFVTLPGAEAINVVTKDLGKCLKHNIDVFKKHDLDFWFIIYFLD